MIILGGCGQGGAALTGEVGGGGQGLLVDAAAGAGSGRGGWLRRRWKGIETKLALAKSEKSLGSC